MRPSRLSTVEIPVRKLADIMEAQAPGAPRSAREYARVAEQIAEYADLTPAQMAAKVKQLEKEMYKAARDLKFERAAAIRGQIKELRGLGLAA